MTLKTITSTGSSLPACLRSLPPSPTVRKGRLELDRLISSLSTSRELGNSLGFVTGTQAFQVSMILADLPSELRTFSQAFPLSTD